MDSSTHCHLVYLPFTSSFCPFCFFSHFCCCASLFSIPVTLLLVLSTSQFLSPAFSLFSIYVISCSPFLSISLNSIHPMSSSSFFFFLLLLLQFLFYLLISLNSFCSLKIWGFSLLCPSIIDLKDVVNQLEFT